MSAINITIYGRTSTADQHTGAGTQVTMVTEAVLQKSKDDGVQRVIVGTFMDENVYSDLTFDLRPQFTAMMGVVKAQSVKEVWMHSRDRLSRDVDLAGYGRTLLKQLGVTIIALDDSEERIVERVKDMLAEEELDKYRQKRQQGQEVAIRDQKAMFRPPFGYTVNKTTHRFEIDPEKKHIVISILHALENDIASARKIALLHNVPVSLVTRIRNNRIYRHGEVWYRGKLIYTIEPILPIAKEAEHGKLPN